MKALRIGEAAIYARVTPNCLRRWEAKGLLTRRVRGTDEARVFLVSDLQRVLLQRPKRGRKAQRKP